MLKKLLFGLTLVSFVGAASAQGLLNKRTSRFNTAKSELKADAKTLDRKVSFDALHATTARVAVKNVPTGMRRAASSSTWFQYSFVSNGRVGILDNTTLATAYEDYGAVGTDSYNMHVVIPARFANAVIDSVCNVFYETEHMTNCRIWIHNIEPNSADSYPIPLSAEYADYSMTVDAKDIKEPIKEPDGIKLQMSDFKLDKPFTVGENGCLVGFQFTAPADSICVVFGGTSVDGGWYHMFDFPTEDDATKTEPYWINMYGAGNLPIGAHMDVTNCSSNNLAANYVLETSLNAGKEGYVGVNVTNDAYNAVENLNYVMTIDGVAQAEQTLTPGEYYNYLVAGGRTTTLFVPCTVDAGEHLVSVEITKVNGNTNEASTKAASGCVLGLDNPADRVSVIEEATSTYCGYCPRGTVGMEKVKEALGDKVVTLSVHGKQSNNYDDPMTCNDYYPFLYYFVSDYPTAYINRVEEADPYAGFYDNCVVDSKDSVTMVKFGLDQAVTLVNEIYPSEGSVALTAQLSEAEKKITVNTTTTFNVDRESVPYSLVFVLTEDGMTGKDSGTALWTQYNYYSQTFIDYYKKRGYDYSTLFTDTDMDRYKNGVYKYTETYNNVVVGAWGGTVEQDGKTYNMCPVIGIPAFENSADIVAGEGMDYSTTLDLSEKTLIQSYRHLKLAVLLLNDNNGMIVNAAQVNLEDPTGIDGAVKDNDNSSVVARYSIDGRKLDAPVKGLNIVKMADGRSMKVLVK